MIFWESNCITTVWTLFYSNMTVSLCIRQESERMMIQSVWKNLTGLQKQLNTSGVTLNEPQTHHKTPMTCTYGFSHFIHFKTDATEVEIQFLSTLIMFPSLLPHFGSDCFSSKESANTFVHTMNVQFLRI